MIRVAAYCRVSTDQDDQVNSFESQQRYFRDCIQRNPEWELQNIYADEGISGTSTKKRKQFNAMISAARAGKLDLIITKEVSRFARNTLDTLEYTRELQQLGVGVIFLIDNIDTQQQEGELRLTIMSSMAQEESRKTSQRVKWGQTRCMERGVVFGGSLLGYNVINGTISVNPEGAEIVRHIFHKYLVEHKGTTVIARELQAEGILSSRGMCKWSASTVLKILKNEKYCGDLVQKKTYTPNYLTHEKKYNKGQESFVVLRDHHEPIIDRNTWQTVQLELKRRSRQKKTTHSHGSKYPLSGKIFCGECKGTFLARYRKGPSGVPYQVWRCGTAVSYGTKTTNHILGCSVGRQIREEAALFLVRRSVQTLSLNWAELVNSLSNIVENVLQNSVDNTRIELEQLEREIEGYRSKKQRAMEEFLKYNISKADFDFLNQRCDNQILHLEQQLSHINLTQYPDARTIRNSIYSAIHELLETDAGEQELCEQLLDHMIIHADGRVEVTLRLISSQWIYLLPGKS